MKKTKLEGLDGVRARAGEELGRSEWREMYYEDIHRFAEATGDRQWIHVDKERIARESPYGAPIAHGYFSLALVAALFFDIVEIDKIKAVLNYGANKVRFPAPLKVGDRYRLSLKIANVKDVVGGVEALMLASIDLRDKPKPACVAEIVYRFLD